MSRTASILFVLSVILLSVAPAAAGEVGVRFSGLETEIQQLIEKLNRHGEDHDLRFIQSEGEYHLRIAVRTDSRSALALRPFSPRMRVMSSELDGSSAVLTEDCRLLFVLDPGEGFGLGRASARVAVLTPDCGLLFAVERSGRLTTGGALNAVAKEIVKNLVRYESRIPSEPVSPTEPKIEQSRLSELPAWQIDRTPPSVNMTRFDLIAHDAELRLLLTSMARAGGLNLSMAPDLTANVTVDLHDVTLLEALDIILDPLNLEYEIGDFAGPANRVGSGRK